MDARSNEDVFRVASETDRFWCAGEVRRFARDIGFGERAQWELAIVAAELISNAVRYGGSGMLTLRTASGARLGMEIVVADSGSCSATATGAPPHATHLGARTGLGLGLRTVHLLCHEVSIERDLRGGTVVTAARYLES